MNAYYTWSDLYLYFGISDVGEIDQKYVVDSTDDGVTLNVEDLDEDGLPDFFDVFLGIVVDINASQEPDDF